MFLYCKISVQAKKTYLIDGDTPGVIIHTVACLVLTSRRDVHSTKAPTLYRSLVANVTNA